MPMKGLAHKCLEPFISNSQLLKSCGTNSRSGNRIKVIPILNDCTIKMSQKFVAFFAMT